MGLGSFIKRQFLDIIEWQDESRDTIVYKFVVEKGEIQNNSKVVVRPGQAAVFVNEGAIADVLTEGTYPLSTRTVPILSDLKGWKFGTFESEFKSDVYFVSLRNFQNNKWGTPTPVLMPDPLFGQVEVRAFGTFGFTVKDPQKFVREISSTNRTYTVEDIQEQLRDYIVTNFIPLTTSLGVSVAQLSTAYEQIRQAVTQGADDEFEALGLDITAFTITSITLPEEVNESLREVTRANMIGTIQNMDKVQRYEATQAMRDSVNNPGMNAINQAGMGVGMGFGMAGMMQQTVAQGMSQQPQQAPAASVPGAVPSAAAGAAGAAAADIQEAPFGGCAECGAPLKENAKFCVKCGAKVPPKEPAVSFCPQCGTKIEGPAGFCPECGTKLDG